MKLGDIDAWADSFWKVCATILLIPMTILLFVSASMGIWDLFAVILFVEVLLLLVAL
jgi:hypothetical protein